MSSNNHTRAIPVTYAKLNFGKIMRLVRSGQRNFIITTYGKPAVVVTSLETFLNKGKKLRAAAARVIITGIDTQ